MVRPSINSVKHYVQVSLATVLAGANSAINVALAVDAPTADSASEVRVGASIKAVYVEMWVRAGDTAHGSTLLTFGKATGGQTMSFAEQIDLHNYTAKNNILYHTQGTTNDQDADAIPFIRMWIKIPKGKQRMALGDRLFLSISAQALDNIICGFMTYKEYY